MKNVFIFPDYLKIRKEFLQWNIAKKKETKIKRVSSSICLDTLLDFVCYKGRVKRFFKFHWIKVSFESFLILLSKYSLESDWILLFGCTLLIPSSALLKSLLFAR